MSSFGMLTSVAASIRESDIDTDIIFPARFLLLPEKAGLGKHLLHERRVRPKPGEQPFVLNRPPFDHARILVTGANFGAGSSREQAVWAIADFGIRCVIAPSFGEIFYANCFKSGVLPIMLDGEPLSAVVDAAEAALPITVDLEAMTILLPGGREIAFAVDAYKRNALLLGLDEIGAILADDLDDIDRFEKAQRRQAPWLYLGDDKLSYFADLGEETAID